MSIRLSKFSESAHSAKAAHNITFAQAIATLDNGYQDWQIIATFYAAMHLLQAYFVAKTSEYPQTHQDRDTALMNDLALRPIYTPYRELKRAALGSRYLCWPVNDHDVKEARKHFDAIQAHITGLLHPPPPAT